MARFNIDSGSAAIITHGTTGYHGGACEFDNNSNNNNRKIVRARDLIIATRTAHRNARKDRRSIGSPIRILERDSC